MALAPLPWSGISNLLKDQTHREKLQKGEQGGAIFTTTSLHDTTLVYMGVRFTCPRCDSEGQEHRLVVSHADIRSDVVIGGNLLLAL